MSGPIKKSSWTSPPLSVSVISTPALGREYETVDITVINVLLEDATARHERPWPTQRCAVAGD
jgi:hypothetical protein